MAKVMVSIPDDLLAAVDAAARRESRTRSGYVQEALRHRLTGGAAARRSTALSALRREFADGAWVAEELVRAERER